MTEETGVEEVMRTARRRQLWTAGPATVSVAYARPEVERLLPHRPPFLFVDEITAVDLEQSAVRGRRTIDPADPVFAGHFPGEPIYPGVLQIETMGQLGLCLFGFAMTGSVAVAPEARPRAVRATRVHDSMFLAEVRPGDVLDILARQIYCDDYTATCAGQLMRDGSVVSLGVMEVYFVED